MSGKWRFVWSSGFSRLSHNAVGARTVSASLVTDVSFHRARKLAKMAPFPYYLSSRPVAT